jgi:cell division protein FtsZ
MMGTGEGTGEDRALMAAQNAIANPLLDEVSLKGAKAVLVNVTGGMDMTLLEVDEAANAISDQVDPEANIIFGAAFDPSLDGVIRVSVVATGMDGASIAQIEPKPVSRNTTAQPLIAETRPAAPQAAPAPTTAEVGRPGMRYEPRPIERPAPVASYAPEPVYEEPAPIVEAQEDLHFEEPVMEEPRVAAPAPRVTRIVDPLVADAGEEEPLYSETYEDRRAQKSGGWMSLFGGGRQQRYEQQPAQQPRQTGSARPQLQPLDQPAADEGEDLEIPSFLRRLAN